MPSWYQLNVLQHVYQGIQTIWIMGKHSQLLIFSVWKMHWFIKQNCSSTNNQNGQTAYNKNNIT